MPTMRIILASLLIVGATSAASASLAAQVRWDPVKRVYFVTAHNDEGDAHEMRVEPADKVIPVTFLTQIDSAGRIFYRYRVTVDSTSPQPMVYVRIPCSAQAAAADLTGGERRAVSGWGGQQYCRFYAPSGIGDTVRPRFSSPMLGGVATAIVEGGRPAAVWPMSEPNSETDSLKPMVDSLQGDSPNGLVKRIPMPAPKYERSAVVVTASGLQILLAELDEVCATTPWIEAGTCAALRLHISPACLVASGARQAFCAPGPDAQVRLALKNFIDALAAGRTNGVVHQNAFSILQLLARTVRNAVGQ